MLLLLSCCCRVAKFNGVHSLDLHFPGTFGSDQCEIHFVGLKGEFSEVRGEGEGRPSLTTHTAGMNDRHTHPPHSLTLAGSSLAWQQPTMCSLSVSGRLSCSFLVVLAYNYRLLTVPAVACVCCSV